VNIDASVVVMMIIKAIIIIIVIVAVLLLLPSPSNGMEGVVQPVDIGMKNVSRMK